MAIASNASYDVLHRFGRMIFFTNASGGVAEEYKGEWKDGMMDGQGEMR